MVTSDMVKQAQEARQKVQPDSYPSEGGETFQKNMKADRQIRILRRCTQDLALASMYMYYTELVSGAVLHILYVLYTINSILSMGNIC